MNEQQRSPVPLARPEDGLATLPTFADITRDLAADLAALQTIDRTEWGNLLVWQVVFPACRRAIAAEAEVIRLQAIIAGLADPCIASGDAEHRQAQSDLLSKRAEGKP